MDPILRLSEVASSIVRSAEPGHVLNFIAVSLVMFLMAVVWQLLVRNRRAPPRTRRRRR